MIRPLWDQYGVEELGSLEIVHRKVPISGHLCADIGVHPFLKW